MKYRGKLSKRQYKPFDAGTYRVRVHSVEDTKSKKGKPMMVLKLDLIRDADGRIHRLTEYQTVTEESLWRVEQLYVAFGAPFEKTLLEGNEEEGTAVWDTIFASQELVGRYAYCQIEHRSWTSTDSKGEPKVNFTEEAVEFTHGANASPDDGPSPWDDAKAKDDDIPF